MSIFIDTNILLRIAQPSHPLHSRALASTDDYILRRETLFITPQIMAEFWNAATRPQENNGLGMPSDQAKGEMEALETLFTVLAESETVYQEWKKLVSRHNVGGVKAHDARIVAAMNIYGIKRILTLNPADFMRYKEIEIITL